MFVESLILGGEFENLGGDISMIDGTESVDVSGFDGSVTDLGSPNPPLNEAYYREGPFDDDVDYESDVTNSLKSFPNQQPYERPFLNDEISSKIEYDNDWSNNCSNDCSSVTDILSPAPFSLFKEAENEVEESHHIEDNNELSVEANGRYFIFIIFFNFKLI